METIKPTQREKFEEDTFPHAEALWRTALWLTLRRSSAEALVLKTMERAYSSWHGSADTVSSKARLFRVLTRVFADADNGKHQPSRFLLEHFNTVADTDNGRQRYPNASIDCKGLTSLTEISDVSVKGAIARLRPQSRLIMILLLRERFSYADIAYIIGLPEDSVKLILSRLRRVIPLYLSQGVDRIRSVEGNCTTFRVFRASSDEGKCGR